MERNPFQRLSLKELHQRTSMKWRTYPVDVLPLWVAEMDVLPATAVTQAVEEAMLLGDTGYAFGGMYAEAMREFAAKRWGWHMETLHTAIVPDVMMGIVEILRLVTPHGAAVVVNSPVYQPFYQFIQNMGRQIIEAPLNDAHRLDLSTLDDAFAQALAAGRSAAYLLCSPHNPTGTVHTEAELQAVTELASTYGIRVIADEIHAPIVMPNVVHVPYLSVRGAENALSVMSASKGWNLAGLKAALAVAGSEAATDLARMPEEVSHGPSHLGVIAHSAALRYGGDWLDELLVGLEENRTLLADLLAQHLPAVRYRQPEGTYLAWLDCRALGLGDDPAAAFLARGKVALNSGPSFGTGGVGHARLNFATSPEIITEAVNRMASSL